MSSFAAELRAAPRGLAAGVAAAVLVVAVLGLVGRWEGGRHARAEVRGMARTLALIRALGPATPSGYRVLPDFDCLVYRAGGNPFALEYCVDADGRVVETIDRRRFERRIDTLREDPDASTLRVDRAEVDRLLRRMEAPCCR